MDSRIDIQENWFQDTEKQLVRAGGLSAALFRYPEGVAAVRLANDRGEVVLLPYQGQQIWRAVFDGRSLGMASMFDAPRPAASVVDSYGMFMYHCGALRLGNPGPGDDHALHGELPVARFRDAAVLLGTDKKGDYLGLTGVFSYKKGFGDYYDATATVRIRPGSALMDISLAVKNVGNYPMDLMYMAHINFRAGGNATILQTSGWTPDDMILRTSIPSHVKPTPKFLAFMDRLKADPSATRALRAGDSYDPEIVYFLRNMKKGKDGLARVLQVHEDGSADSVAWNPAAMDKHVRWILVNRNQKVIGLIPGTCEPEGYTAEKKKGFVRTLGAGRTAEFRVTAGLLSRSEARAAAKGMKTATA